MMLDLALTGGHQVDPAQELPAAEPLARRRVVIDPLTGIVDVDRILATGKRPQANLAILDAHARQALLGRGFYQPPASLFAPAWIRSGLRLPRTRLRS